jgi:hypothetical protein
MVIRTSKESGLSLVGVMVAGALLSVALMTVAQLTHSNRKAAQKVESSIDVAALKLKVSQEIDCGRSFGAANPPCVVGSYVDLRGDNGQIVVASGGTTIGRWTVRARCLSTGVDVRAASLSAAGRTQSGALDFDSQNTAWFLTDPGAANLLLHWGHIKAQLFEPSSGGYCSHLFGAGNLTAQCNPNQYVAGVDFVNRNLLCKNIPVCPANEALNWNGNNLVCVPARGMNYIETSHIQPIINTTKATLRATPIDIFHATRAGSGAVFGGGGFVESFTELGETERGLAAIHWGVRCRAPYIVLGCTIGNSITGDSTLVNNYFADWDVGLGNRGCYSNMEEFAHGATLGIICGRLGRP